MEFPVEKNIKLNIWWLYYNPKWNVRTNLELIFKAKRQMVSVYQKLEKRSGSKNNFFKQLIKYIFYSPALAMWLRWNIFVALWALWIFLFYVLVLSIFIFYFSFHNYFAFQKILSFGWINKFKLLSLINLDFVNLLFPEQWLSFNILYYNVYHVSWHLLN